MNALSKNASPGSAPKCRACGQLSPQVRVLTGYAFEDRLEVFDVLRCEHCGLAHTSPFPDAKKLRGYYSSSYYGDGNQRKFRGPVEWFVQCENRSRVRRLLKHNERDPSNPRPLRVLDIGCGRAGFLKILCSREIACFGLDIPGFPLPPPGPNLDFLSGVADQLSFEDDAFDAVSIWHVLEHVEQPASVLSEISRVLKPGGVLALAVPNFGSLQARAFGRHWFHLDLPRHLYHFTRPVLTAMLRDVGFELLSLSTQSIQQNLFGFVQSGLNYIFHGAPNRLYGFLNAGQWRSISFAEIVPHLVVTALILPLAILEYIGSGILGSGGTLIIYARKMHSG